MKSAGIGSLLVLPMVFQERVVGLVEIKDAQNSRFFSDREITLAQLLATHAAVALENAALYDRAQREIQRRKLAERQIRQSLEEKEVLLKEIHHRVKNNLQIISSLLSLQSSFINDDKALEAFKDSQHRVRSMALIHERLYRSEDLAEIELGDYIRGLTAYLIQAYRSRRSQVHYQVESDGVVLEIEKAVPCGLIINELLSNALKHAFPESAAGQSNEIIILVRRTTRGQVMIEISDNGIGLPPDFDPATTSSLGLQIVNTLVAQLDGVLEFHSEVGTRITITFDAPLANSQTDDIDLLPPSGEHQHG
jgi:two-component sensor histidine kinase